MFNLQAELLKAIASGKMWQVRNLLDGRDRNARPDAWDDGGRPRVVRAARAADTLLWLKQHGYVRVGLAGKLRATEAGRALLDDGNSRPSPTPGTS